MLKFTDLNDKESYVVKIKMDAYKAMRREYFLGDKERLEQYLKHEMTSLGINTNDIETLKRVIALGYKVQEIPTKSADGAKDGNGDQVGEQR